MGLRQWRREGALAEGREQRWKEVVGVQGGCGGRAKLKEGALVSWTEGGVWTFGSTKSWAVAKLLGGTAFRPGAAEPRTDSGEPFMNGVGSGAPGVLAQDSEPWDDHGEFGSISCP